MATPTNLPAGMDKLNMSTAEVEAAAKDYYNTQLEIEKSLAAQNTQLLSMLGLNKELNVSYKQILKRIDENKNAVEQAILHERELMIQYDNERDPIKKREIKVNLASIVARKAHLQSEIDMLQNMMKFGLIPIIFALGKILGVFKSMDKAAAEFRMKMGATRDTVESLRLSVQNVAISLMNVGVSIEGAYQSMYALGEVMGGVHNVSRDLVETTALLKAQLGVAEEDSAKFMKNMAAVSKTTMQSQKSLAYFTKSLSNAAGVPLPLVMKDIATLSGTTMNLMAKFPLQIAKAAVEFRRLGTTINDVSKASESILDFTSSVNKEMEASVLLGQSLNLQKARQLSYEGKLQEANAEMLNQARRLGFQNRMDYFQRKATAEALGMSVESIYAQLQAQDQIRDALNSSDPIVRKMADEYYRLKNLNETNADIEGKSAEDRVRALANQERLVAVQNKLNQVVAKLSEIFLPIIDRALSFAPALIDVGIALMNVFAIAKGFTMFTSMAVAITNIGNSLVNISKLLRVIGISLNLASIVSFGTWVKNIGLGLQTAISTAGKFSAVVGFFHKLGNIGFMILQPFIKIGAIIGKFAGFLSPFLKFMGPIGVIITAFQFINGFIEGWKNTEGNIFEKLIGGIWAGIKAVVKPIFDLLVWPFKAAAKLIGLDWFGESPSKIGLSIVNGLVSVGAMIFDALTSPWRMALAWIADKIPGMGNVAEKLRGGLNGIINTPIETKAMATYVPAVTVTPNGTKIEGNANVVTSTGGEIENKSDISTLMTEETGKALIQAMNGIREDLRAGLIGINMDGQLLSATLSRQTEFRNGYGVNKARV
jgi:hypothetical protein